MRANVKGFKPFRIPRMSNVWFAELMPVTASMSRRVSSCAGVARRRCRSLLIVSLITFGMMQLIPGDPAAVIGGHERHAGADRRRSGPISASTSRSLVQLVRWYGGLLQGDLGRSILLGQAVMPATLQRLPVTIALSAYALVLTLLLGLASGIIAALRQNTWIDQAAMMFALLGISMPNFWLGLLMIILFAVQLGWLPTGGYVAFTDDPVGWLRTSTMPAISLALLQVGPARAHHALDHAGGAAPGLHPHGARQGAAAAARGDASMRWPTR